MQNIPVIVDDIVDSSTFPLARLIYFHIEAEETLDQWWLRHPQIPFGLPFLMIGLAGILVRPIDGGEIFEHSHQLRELFNFIERPTEDVSDSSTMVQVSDIWFPKNLMFKQGETPSRGDVFRVDSDLFRHAFDFRAGRLQDEEFLSAAMRQEDRIHFSSVETKAFTQWAYSESESRFGEDLYLPRRGETHE